MKKRKITVLSATVLLAIVAFPFLTIAATEAPVRSVESFVLGTSGFQMNLQLAPDDSIVPGGATVGPAYVTPPLVACPPNGYCVEDCEIFDTSCNTGNFYCPDLVANGPPDPDTCPGATWSCDQVDSIVICNWYEEPDPDGGVAFPCSDNVATLPTLCPLPINAPIINAPTVTAPAVAAPASGDFEVLPIADITTSLVCTDCIPVSNGYECVRTNCETREFVERNIMEEYEGSCTYKYTTTTGQTVTKRITGKPPACP